ncbi:MAG: hypothetical protein ACFFD7_11755 [Candidatus Thorarchaeota archaeon]
MESKKKRIWQISLTSLTFFLTVILPIIGFFQFEILNELFSDVYKLTYKLVFIQTLVIGVVLTVLRFSLYQFPLYSIKRGFLNLVNSLLLLVFFGISAQIASIEVSTENFRIHFNLAGVFLFLIIIWSLFLIKNFYDLYDFRKNHTYYKRISRN